jgi:peptide-methionine (R)-S-oxide reductase|tara:strand:- start:1530 stop:2003 length:474 start_codon:yes stop_codon:yes gene_type:complete
MKSFIKLIFFLIVTLSAQQKQEKIDMSKKILKSDSEWETCLTPEEYKILREKGTEMAFTGKFYNHKEDGTYSCAGCDYELFSSETKFDSGTGWPSFYQALEKDRIIEKEDKTLGMTRVEILCARCESHLGHVFTDGPNPTGLRYCVNSVSLDFKELK